MNGSKAKLLRRWNTISAEAMGRAMEVYRVALNSEPLHRCAIRALRLLCGRL
jgi:hypothetical protein